MQKITEFCLSHKTLLLILFTVISVISVCMYPFVEINYNLTDYLADDIDTKKAISVMEEEFGFSGMAEVMVEGVSLPEAVELKGQIAAISGVKTVLWLDSLADPMQPLDYTGDAMRAFYKDETAYYQVEFEENDYSLKTSAALKQIDELIGENGYVGGSAASVRNMREAMNSEILKIIAFALPIFLVLLFLSTTSWLEPLLYLIVIGISVVINMGTNLFLGEISFITQATAAILQMAISMDYSLFLLHRFNEERQHEPDLHIAMTTAVKRSFPSLIASCLTTVAGFVALMFMRYRIGLDMGIVLAKGIVISLLSVLLLLPVLALLLVKWVDKTSHRPFLPKFHKFGKVAVKCRYLIVLLVLLVVPAYLAQNSNHFLYGESAVTSSEGAPTAREQERITEKFGLNNPVMVLVPKGDIAKQTALAEELQQKDYVKQVQSLVTSVDPTMSRDILPQAVIDQFESEHYSRFIVQLNVKSESDETFEAINDLKATLQQSYPDSYYLVGSSSSVSDIRQVVESDYVIVNLVSIAAIALIILFTFKSISLPIILVFVIEASIWINMAIPYFQGINMAFIGYMIVSAIQLGATIDYAILLTSRYTDNRRTQPKREAAVNAVASSATSIVTSCGVLCAAGFAVGLVSSIKGIEDMGILIGRGALLSGLLVLIALPQLLVLLDRFIDVTTFKGGKEKKWVRKKQAEK